MCRFAIISLLVVLHLLCVHSIVKNTSNNYLPLVIINHKNRLELPNQIDKANINEILGFTGDTRFSKDKSKNQWFFCPAYTTKQMDSIGQTNTVMQSTFWLRSRYSETKVTRNCLFRKTFAEDETLRCGDDAIPIIDQVKIGKPGHGKLQQCGPNKKYTIYKFVYEVCSPVNISERLKGYTPRLYKLSVAKFDRNKPFLYEQFTVYEICYDRFYGEGTIFTKHVLKSVNLLFDERLQHEKEKQHLMMTGFDGYEYFKNQFDTLKEKYDQLSSYTKRNSSNTAESDFVETPIPYLAEKLVSPDDMITALLRKLTFHYINVKPMHQSLVKGWNYIEGLIRKNFKNQKTENEIEIYTGAFKSSNPNHNLLKDSPVDIPKVWVKFLREKKKIEEESSTLVILMMNEDVAEGGKFEFEPALDVLCEHDYCEKLKEVTRQFIYFPYFVEKIRCCPFNEKINDAFFGLNLKYGNTLLQIANLTDKETGKL